MVTFTWRIEGQFSPGVWTSFGSDVIGGISWQRGNPSATPIDSIAIGGSLDFILRNDSGSLLGSGSYSPNHPNCRSGFEQGMLLRVVYTYEAVDYVRWTGKLEVIDPSPGQYSDQRVLCHAIDFMGELADIDIREVPVQIEEAEDTILGVVLDSLPTESQPLARDIDAGLSIFPVALDDLTDGTKGLAVIERIVTSAQGRAFTTGDGTFRYVNYDTASLQVPVFAFASSQARITVPTGKGNVFNRVRLILHPKDIPAATIVLAEALGNPALDAGAIDEFFLTYRDPDHPDTYIGGTDFVDPMVSGTDYLWNSAADGSGTNLTASVSTVATFFGSTVKITITNNSGVTAYRRILQVRGRGIFDYGEMAVESYTPRPYGNKPVELDLPYQDDSVLAKVRAAFIDATYRDLADQVSTVEFYPQREDLLMQLMMDIEVGDVIECTDPQILPGGALALVQQITCDINTEGVAKMVMVTAPWIVQAGIINDGIEMDDTFSATDAAPEDRIDFADIGYSEVA